MAAGRGRELEIAIRIAGRVESSFKNALGAVTKGVGSLAKSIGSITGPIQAATAAAASAMVSLGEAAVNVGKEFEGAMSQVAATMLIDKTTEEGQKKFETLENAARECGASTAFSATEAAEALNYLALAGYDAEKAATALPTVLKLAGAGAMELGRASDMVTDSMSALGIEATEEELTRFSDKLAKTASTANTSVSQLGEAILTVGGTAKGLAGGTTELNAALGILADNGLKGAEGGTHLRNIILSLQSPTDKASKALQELGVETYAKGKMRGLNEIFKDLQNAMGDMSNAQKDNIISTLFNKTDLVAANAMLSNCAGRFDELSEAIENSAGACENMYAIQLDNLEGDIQILQSGLQDLGISVYKDLNKPLREMTQLASRMVGKLSAAYKDAGMEGMAGAAGDCLAEVVKTIAGYAPKVIKMGIDVFTSFISGIMANADQIAGTAVELISVFIGKIRTLLPQIIFAGLDIIVGLVQGIVEQLPQILHMGALAVVNFINGLGQRIPDIIAAALALVRALVQGIAENAPMLLQSGVQLIISLVQGILDNLGSIVQTAIQILITLGMGLIQGIPQLVAAIPQIMWAIAKVLLDVNFWIDLGKGIVKGIINGILGAGKGIGNAVKSLFSFGKSNSSKEAEKSGESFASSMTNVLFGSAGKISAAADSMTESVFGNMDVSSLSAAGSQAGAAFSSGLNGELTGSSINAGSAMNVGAPTMDTSGFTAAMMTAGSDGAAAANAGMTGNSQAVTQAATTLGNNVNTALDQGWNQANTSAQTAMQQLTQIVTDAASAAVNAIKSAFENMTITIPKPKIPNINVSTNTVPYGNGGSVSVPKFSVAWNALGGIFDRPTILNTSSGMQGVGEAGPEAILPLDTLWTKMKEILEEAISTDSAVSKIGALTKKLEGIGPGVSSFAPQIAGAGGPTIQYSPVYNLYGTAGKEEIAEADHRSQAEFNRMIKQYERDLQRRRL